MLSVERDSNARRLYVRHLVPTRWHNEVSKNLTAPRGIIDDIMMIDDVMDIVEPAAPEPSPIAHGCLDHITPQ